MDQAERLRNVIKQSNIQQQTARVFTVTSGKGGVGKSNLAVNMAVWFRKIGKRVIIIDADLGLANVEVMFGSVPKNNLSDLIYRGKSAKEIINEGPLGIGFTSGGVGIAGLNNLSRDQIVYLVHSLAELNELADIVIIDTGAGIADSVLEFVLASPEVVLVSTPDPSSLTDAYSLLKALYRNPSFSEERTRIHIVANKVTSVEEGNIVFAKLNSVVTQFLKGSIHFLGMIPQDREMEHAVRSQKIISLEKPNAASSRAFKLLTDNYIHDEQKTISMHKGITQFITNLLARRGS